ncbi:MAG: HlyD family efflux transporter periplasmic adaptor subunit [Burkholderiales bacterium]|nr:HlyD family efflux transporter periplasmic adaptor subunit [Burkholderiales bacterium]
MFFIREHSLLHARFLLVVLGAVALAACSDKSAPAWSGYAEGDYVYVAAPLAGRLDAVAVQAGQSVAQGAPLFTLDAESEQAAQQEAAARLASAQAQAANLNLGRRREEIAVTQAQLTQAQAAETLAYSDLQRQQQLLAQGFVAKARVDDATTQLGLARARVAELAAVMQVAKLPARTDERAAQRANAQAASEVLRQSTWRTRQKQQTAPSAALVADVFFQPGEWVGAGQPVVSLLPPGNTKARFFVPEADLGGLKAGQAVTLTCDGCGAPMAATVSRIATQPEYTPPVIYSNAQRSKLVFMVEAKPSPQDAARLKPGQPLDVRIAVRP